MSDRNRISLRRAFTGIAGAAVIAGGITVLGVVPAASADTCNNARNISITGAESHYTLTCSGGRVYVDGRVKDTRADGKCAQVKALIDGRWYYSDRACPNGTTKYFSWSGPGNTAYVYTQVV